MAILPSILRREKHRRDGAICFGDDPELLVVCRFVGREESESFSKRPFVLLDVLFAEFTPVAALMAQQGCGNLQCGECGQRSWRRINPEDRESHSRSDDRVALLPGEGERSEQTIA